MRRELDEKLVNDFPNLYADRYQNMQVTCMCWGFDCGDGWEPIIRELSEELEKIIVKLKEEFPTANYFPKAVQVKEKYGTLRFYLSSETDEMKKHLLKAYRKSAKTCEVCGKRGEIRGKYWLYTACIDHTNEEHLTKLERVYLKVRNFIRRVFKCQK